MFIEKEDYFELKELKEYGIRVIYTTKSFVDVRDENDRGKVKELFKFKNENIYSGVQTHSSNIVIIDENCSNISENTDGFLTQNKKAIIFTKYADCLPIYLYDKKNEVFGCVHSGWQGSFEEIGVKAIKKMQDHFNSKLENIVVAFGIGISIKNYEVSEEFYNNFRKKFDIQLLKNVFSKKGDHYFFDNQKFNYNLVLNYGIEKENIISNDLCTYDGDFHSYRRDKEKSGRNGAYIFIDKKE